MTAPTGMSGLGLEKTYNAVPGMADLIPLTAPQVRPQAGSYNQFSKPRNPIPRLLGPWREGTRTWGFLFLSLKRAAPAIALAASVSPPQQVYPRWDRYPRTGP